MDFTINQYIKLIESLQKEGYAFQTFSDFIKNPKEKSIILRHDVDLRPENSLRFAKIQQTLNVVGSYYFRAVPVSWDEKVIREISQMGHEIGYHYENLSTCKGDIDAAYCDFCKNLESLRTLTDVITICMHGSPLSAFDSKDIWEKYNYRSLKIIGEPYFDIDFNNVLYLTDTGRRWDGYHVSVRDKIPIHQERWRKNKLEFHSTKDIIENCAALPDQIMFTFHPQRWNKSKILWVKELIFQNVKNQIKALKIKFVRSN
jgi:hypothetical protein